MKVKIVRLLDKQAVEAQIINPARVTLPSITDGWRFNFKKHSKKNKLPNLHFSMQ